MFESTPFIWGQNGEALTPAQVARKRELAELARQRAGDTSPVGHWTQGAARVVDALGGVLNEKRADRAEREGLASADDFIANNPVLASLIGSGGSGFSVGVPESVIPSGSTPSIPAGADEIRAGLLARGLPEHVADAFILNFQDESGLNPGINEANPIVPGSRGGYGLYQLTGPRRVAYEKFASERGVDPSNVDAQLDFLMHELQGPESAAAEAIFSAPDTGTAAAAIVNKFLRPAAEHRERRASRYLGGASAPTGGAPMPDNSRVIAALSAGMSNPWVAQKYGPVIEALMGQQMQRGNMAYEQQLRQQDPMYQAKLEKMMQPEAVDPFAGTQVINGQLVQMTDTGPQVIGDYRTDEAAPTPMTPEERAAWGIPADDTRPYMMVDGTPKLIGGGGVTVNNQMGGGKFDEEFAKGDAQTLVAVSESGLAARRNIGRINELDQLLQNSPTGFSGIAKQMAGNWGINTEGLSDIQAAQALINSMVPEQRPPGSGPMSDADLELFKQSLPRIINQPEGNHLIINTMRAIAEYDAEGAAIVQKLRAGEVTRADAFDQLKNRADPLSGIRGSLSGAGDQGADEAAGNTAETGGGAVPQSFSQKYQAEAEAAGLTIEELWDAWGNKEAFQ